MQKVSGKEQKKNWDKDSNMDSIWWDSNFLLSKIFRDNLSNMFSNHYPSGKSGPSTQIIVNLKHKITEYSVLGNYCNKFTY